MFEGGVWVMYAREVFEERCLKELFERGVLWRCLSDVCMDVLEGGV